MPSYWTISKLRILQRWLSKLASQIILTWVKCMNQMPMPRTEGTRASTLLQLGTALFKGEWLFEMLHFGKPVLVLVTQYAKLLAPWADAEVPCSLPWRPVGVSSNGACLTVCLRESERERAGGVQNTLCICKYPHSHTQTLSLSPMHSLTDTSAPIMNDTSTVPNTPLILSKGTACEINPLTGNTMSVSVLPSITQRVIYEKIISPLMHHQHKNNSPSTNPSR